MNQSNIDWILSSFCLVTDGADMDHVLIVCATSDTTPLTIDPHGVVMLYIPSLKNLSYVVAIWYLSLFLNPVQLLPQLLDRMVISLGEGYCVGSGNNVKSIILQHSIVMCKDNNSNMNLENLVSIPYGC